MAQAPVPQRSDTLLADVLEEIQARFPLQPRPYAAVGATLGVGEEEVLACVAGARDAGILRQVSAIFDTRSLGYHSSLVAMRVRPGRLERAVAVVSAHPGVTHNYLRDHTFNLWFTLAVPPGEDLDAVVARMHELAAADCTRAFPTLRLFKVGVVLRTDGAARRAHDPGASYGEQKQARALRRALDDEDRAFVLAAQDDLSRAPDPFETIGERLGWSVEQSVERARSLQAAGQMRRFGALLNHRRAGFVANGMVVWDVPDEQVEAFGRAAGALPAVTHCYQRPTYADWPYNVFTMVHGRTRAEVERVVNDIEHVTGVSDRAILYSTTEFKKVRMRYFEPEEQLWEQRCMSAAERWGR